MLAVVAESITDRSPPQAGDHRQRFLEAVEPFLDGRERDAVEAVFGFIPARAEAELDPTPAHLVDLGNLNGQRPRVPKRRRGHEHPETDGGGLAGKPGHGQPRIGGARRFLTPVVVASDEPRVSALLGRLRQLQVLFVQGRPRRRRSKHRQLHGRSMPYREQTEGFCHHAGNTRSRPDPTSTTSPPTLTRIPPSALRAEMLIREGRPMNRP